MSGIITKKSWDFHGIFQRPDKRRERVKGRGVKAMAGKERLHLGELLLDQLLEVVGHRSLLSVKMG